MSRLNFLKEILVLVKQSLSNEYIINDDLTLGVLGAIDIPKFSNAQQKLIESDILNFNRVAEQVCICIKNDVDNVLKNIVYGSIELNIRIDDDGFKYQINHT